MLRAWAVCPLSSREEKDLLTNQQFTGVAQATRAGHWVPKKCRGGWDSMSRKDISEGFGEAVTLEQSFEGHAEAEEGSWKRRTHKIHSTLCGRRGLAASWLGRW